MPAEWCDGFLQLVKSGQPIKGESTDMEFPESIEILSFKFGTMSGFADTEEFTAVQKVGEESTPENSDKKLDSYQGKDLADVEACNFQIVKEMDISSPDLFRAYCSAADLEHREVFDSGTVTLRKATGKARLPFLTYTFNDLVVVGYSLEIGGDASPKETINLSFGKVRVEFKPQKSTGALSPAIKGGWDFIERTSW
jgi:type VI protein secretion system component Hcp